MARKGRGQPARKMGGNFGIFGQYRFWLSHTQRPLAVCAAYDCRHLSQLALDTTRGVTKALFNQFFAVRRYADAMHNRARFITTICLAALLSACGGPTAAESWKQAQAHYAQNEYSSARIELMNAADVYGGRADFALLEAKVNIALGDGIAAEAAAKRALAKGANPAKVRFLLAESYLILGKAEEALALVESGALGAQTGASRIAGEALIALRRNDEAKARLEQALASGEEPGRVHIMLGNLAMATGDLSAADSHAIAATKLLPKHPGGPLLAARIAVARNFPKRAAKHFAKVLDLRPNHREAMLGRAAALFESGNLKAASEQIQKALAMNEADPKAQFIEARIAFAKGDVEGAHRTMQSVINALDNDPAALAFAGELALKRNAPAIAEVRFEQAILLDPETLHLRYLLAKAQLAKGDLDSAQEQLAYFDGLEEQPVEVMALRRKMAALALSGNAL